MMARSTSGERRREGAGSTLNGRATTGYEAKLWAMADALSGSMDAAAHKHVVLGLTFLKSISDALQERRATLLAECGGGRRRGPTVTNTGDHILRPPDARCAESQGTGEAVHPADRPAQPPKPAFPGPGRHRSGSSASIAPVMLELNGSLVPAPCRHEPGRRQVV